MCECEVSIKRPCGYKTALGKAEITTKRLIWAPTSRTDTQMGDWHEGGVSIPLQRIIAAREKGGGLGFGLTDGFELVFDTGPAWWFKEAEIDPKATTWSLMFVRQGERRDEFASLLEGARKDCKRLENLTTPQTLVHARVRRLCRICVRNPGCKSELESWHAFMKQQAAGSGVSSSAVLDRARKTVRALRDTIFVSHQIPMREAVMSCPGWLVTQRDGPHAVRKAGWVRLLRVGAQQTNDLWKRRFLVLHSDSLSWYVEEEAATRQHAPPTPLALFRCVEIVRLLDVIEISAGDTPLIMRLTISSSSGGEAAYPTATPAPPVGRASEVCSGSEEMNGSISLEAPDGSIEAQVELELDRSEDMTEWMRMIWQQKSDYAAQQQVEREQRQAAAAEMLAKTEGGGDGGDGLDRTFSEQGMRQLQSELMDATALPPGLEEQDSANEEILSMIVAYVERIALLPWVGMLLRSAHDCALVRAEEEMGADSVSRLETNLQTLKSVPQTARFWGLKENTRSASEWSATAMILTRLQTTAFVIRAGATPGYDGLITEVAEAVAALPSSLFQVLVDARDSINSTYIEEHEEAGGQDRPRRVLGGDDLIPIFIFALARSSDSAAAGAGVGAILLAVQEWMTRLGASTDASAEEYMSTSFGAALQQIMSCSAETMVDTTSVTAVAALEPEPEPEPEQSSGAKFMSVFETDGDEPDVPPVPEWPTEAVASPEVDSPVSTGDDAISDLGDFATAPPVTPRDSPGAPAEALVHAGPGLAPRPAAVADPPPVAARFDARDSINS